MDDNQAGPYAPPRHPPEATRQLLPRGEMAALVFALVLPSLVTLAYFVVLVGLPPAIVQSAYLVLKIVQFGFPAVWVFLVVGEKLRLTRPKLDGLWLAGAFGLVIACAMIALALLVLKPTGFLDGPIEAIEAKLLDLGIDSLVKYVALSIFYCLVHSLMEEYYWRWFVFKRLRLRTSLTNAILISSLGFMAHHVIVLAIYFGWASPATYLLSACVAIGGAVWAWIYERSGSLYAAWLSHLLIDGGIFSLGFVLARNVLQ